MVYMSIAFDTYRWMHLLISLGFICAPNMETRPAGAGFSWNDMGVTKTDVLTSCVVSAESIQGRTLELQTQRGESDSTRVCWQVVSQANSALRHSPKLFFVGHFILPDSGSVRMAYWLGRFCKKSLPNAETCQVEYQRCFTNVIYIPPAEHQPHLR